MTTIIGIWHNIAFGVLLHSWGNTEVKWEGKFILQPSSLRTLHCLHMLMTSI